MNQTESPPLRPRPLMKAGCKLVVALAFAGLVIGPVSADQVEEPAGHELNELETALVATLEESTFIGRWHPVADGEVGEEQRDQYSIAGAQKVAGNRWVIRARLRADMPNVIIPVPLRIEWAGDTPVLIVDNFGLPGMNRYSARVLLFDDTYAGTWSGGGIAGLISGVIVRKAEGADKADDADEVAEDEPAAP